MSYCVSPGCKRQQNTATVRFCLNCGSQILLKDRYRALKPIGQGGFGKTFLALDEHIPSKPNCVIKQLFFTGEDTSTFNKVVLLFRQEAVRLDELGQHPQIPELLAHFEQDRQLYLVQEFIEGQTLADELREKGTYNEEQIWQLLRDLLPILDYIHARRVIHRDIKPANIIRRQSDRKLILIDFGVAKLFTDTTLQHTGTIVGSPDYMAPEQHRGKVFPASDLYSLGATCIHLLTGVRPLEMFDIINDEWTWRRHLLHGNRVSDRLGQFLDKLLTNSLKERYQNAIDVIKDIAAQASPALLASSTTPTGLVSPTSSAYNAQTVLTKPPKNHKFGSEVGVDYRKLRDLLAAGKWKEADRETWVVMCQAVGKSPSAYIFSIDIEKLPCQDLWTINALWVKYSKGHFGFSVQHKIYQEVDKEYASFCDRIGWPTHVPTIADSAFKFNLKAPQGHLPSRIWAGGQQWWRHAGSMAARLEGCDIS